MVGHLEDHIAHERRVGFEGALRWPEVEKTPQTVGYPPPKKQSQPSTPPAPRHARSKKNAQSSSSSGNSGNGNIRDGLQLLTELGLKLRGSGQQAGGRGGGGGGPTH